MDIVYVDRKTGEKRIEKVYGHRALSLLYGDGFWQRIFSLIFLPLFARLPFFSWWYGYCQKRPRSRKKIAPFIEIYEIDASEFVEKDFPTFNDFFIRKLKKEKRPVVADPQVLAMPADGRYLVYPTFDEFAVKGKSFSLLRFLDNDLALVIDVPVPVLVGATIFRVVAEVKLAPVFTTNFKSAY